MQFANTCLQRNRPHSILLRYSTFPVTPFALNTPHPVSGYQNQGQGETFAFFPPSVGWLFPGCWGWAVLAPGMFPPLLLWPPVPRSAPWKRFAAYLSLPFFPISFFFFYLCPQFLVLFPSTVEVQTFQLSSSRRFWCACLVFFFFSSRAVIKPHCLVSRGPTAAARLPSDAPHTSVPSCLLHNPGHSHTHTPPSFFFFFIKSLNLLKRAFEYCCCCSSLEAPAVSLESSLSQKAKVEHKESLNWFRITFYISLKKDFFTPESRTRSDSFWFLAFFSF